MDSVFYRIVDSWVFNTFSVLMILANSFYIWVALPPSCPAY